MTQFSDIASLINQVAIWKKNGEKVVFTNGVFDILHVGHVTYLEKAKTFGDKLIVAINDDASVRRLNKGPERPINQEEARATVINALRSVDATIIFKEDTPLQLILSIMPDVLVKGGDYDPNETDPSQKTFIVGSKEVRAHGGLAESIQLVSGFSTTGIVKKLQK